MARDRKANAARSAGAWVGVVTMLVSIVCLELLPRQERFYERENEVPSLAGPISCVVIDAGHGGRDSGAIRGVILEKDLTLDVAQRLERLVRAQGFRTVMTRNSDEAVSLASRAESANRERDCVFVSIHFDEGARATATGVQTFYAARKLPRAAVFPSWLPFMQQVSAVPNDFESESLAALVQAALVSRTHAVDRGTRAEQFFVVANVQHPAVLVEGGFLSNDEDIGRLTTESYREELAAAISEGIVRYRQLAASKPGA